MVLLVVRYTIENVVEGGDTVGAVVDGVGVGVVPENNEDVLVEVSYETIGEVEHPGQSVVIVGVVHVEHSVGSVDVVGGVVSVGISGVVSVVSGVVSVGGVPVGYVEED